MKRIAAMIAACCCAACSTPEPRYYVLDAAAPREARHADGPPVLVASVSIPPEVDRPQMVLATAGSEVAIDDGHRWASPLQAAVTNALARALASSLGEARVQTESRFAAWPGWRLDVQITEFGSRLDREARIEATWQLRRDGVVRDGAASLREPASGGFDGLAQAHGRALSRLAVQIADAVAREN
jgi:uncharacterized lipoprotein YmbA